MHTQRADRRGLAMLEFVLALPILLLIMALMINFGTAACWKVRTLTAARLALWNSRSGHCGSDSPRPAWWPASASATASGGGHAEALDDPRVDQPVARGPLPFGVVVRSELLDPTRGLHSGSASLTGTHPMLARMGSYHLAAQSALLDDSWAYSEMGLPDNAQRRIPSLYELTKAPPDLVQAYVRAVLALRGAPFRPALRPLDQDDEFIAYGALLGLTGSPPDFHPRLEVFCSLDRELADEHVQELIDRIQGRVERDERGNVIGRVPDVAERMARAFINLYQQVIQHTQGSPDLQAKVNILEQFLQALASSRGG